jgi:hypothetical protein
MSDNIYVFRAGLVGYRGVTRKLAVGGDEMPPQYWYDDELAETA